MRKGAAPICLASLPLIVGATEGGPPSATFPDACPALPSGQLISGMATGQAVQSGRTVTLRFSSKVFTCTDWSNDVSGADCRDWWSFHLTLPGDSLSPCVYKLSEMGTEFGDLINHLHPLPGKGCRQD